MDVGDPGPDVGLDIASDAWDPADVAPALSPDPGAPSSDADADPDIPDAPGPAADAAADAASDALDVDDADDVDVAPPPPPFEYAWEPDGACGMPAYQWLLPDQVGELVEWSENISYNLTPEMIQLLAEEAGYEGLLTAGFGTRVFSIRYTTQDRGALVQATAMVGVPDIGPAGEGALESFPTVLSLHPTVGYGPQCSPSQSLVGAASALLPAAMGYVSVAPDLLGLCAPDTPCGGFHPYLNGEPTALVSLDAVRAAFQLLELLSAELAIAPDPRVVPWGASQGGHAALFVDRYAPVYAPELQVPCVVAMVPPSDLAGQATHALETLDAAAALGTAFLAGAVMWYQPEGGAAAIFNADGPLDYTIHIPETFKETCSAGDLVAGASAIGDVYAADFLAAATSGGLFGVEPWACIAGESSLPQASVPYLGDSAVLFILGEQDELVDHAVELASVQTLCDQGYDIQLLDCADGNHVDTAVGTIALQFNWVEACLSEAGIAPEALCVPSPAVDCGAP